MKPEDLERELNPSNGHAAAFDPASFAPVLEIPVWDIDIRASDWAPMPLCQLDYDDPVQRQVINTGRFRLRILGDCMTPDYASGQVVELQLMRIDSEGLQVGHDYAVCRTDGLATFKRLVATNEDTISLAATNQKDHPGILVVYRQEIGRLAKVVGRILPPPDPKLPKIRGVK